MEKSPEDMAAAQALVQKMIALDSDPNTSEVITPRQRENMIQLINELKRAGVPVTPQ
jgi:bacterioferritin (cytochrome b1)